MLADRLLRVPPPPRAPAGSPDSVRLFRPARGFYRYRLLLWGLGQVGAVFGLITGFAAVELGLDFLHPSLGGIVGLLGVAAFVLQLPVTFLLVKVDFDHRWYLVTDRSLRIREGIVQVREQTMSFANIQNLGIRQGPLQRLFGIADLRVRTAGGGGEEGQGEAHEASKNLHLGYFRGVGNPQQIRDTILRRLKRHRDAGLGDPDEPSASAGPAVDAPPGAPSARPSPSVAAARELVAEARALRHALDPHSAQQH